MVSMRCSLLGLIEQTAQALEAQGDHGSAYAWRAIAENLQTVARDPSCWAEFANLYCLTLDDLDRKAAP